MGGDVFIGSSPSKALWVELLLRTGDLFGELACFWWTHRDSVLNKIAYITYIINSPIPAFRCEKKRVFYENHSTLPAQKLQSNMVGCEIPEPNEVLEDCPAHYGR